MHRCVKEIWWTQCWLWICNSVHLQPSFSFVLQILSPLLCNVCWKWEIGALGDDGFWGSQFGMGTAEWRASKKPTYYDRISYIPGLKVKTTTQLTSFPFWGHYKLLLCFLPLFDWFCNKRFTGKTHKIAYWKYIFLDMIIVTSQADGMDVFAMKEAFQYCKEYCLGGKVHFNAWQNCYNFMFLLGPWWQWDILPWFYHDACERNDVNPCRNAPWNLLSFSTICIVQNRTSSCHAF